MLLAQTSEDDFSAGGQRELAVNVIGLIVREAHLSPAHRTAVKQRPHQEAGHDEARPSVFNGLLGSLAQELDSPPTMRARQFD